MVIDDVQMRPVKILAEFMSVDPAWELIHNFSGKTLAFKKIRDSVHDVAWHMQPFTVPKPSLPRQLARQLKRLVKA